MLYAVKTIIEVGSSIRGVSAGPLQMDDDGRQHGYGFKAIQSIKS